MAKRLTMKLENDTGSSATDQITSNDALVGTSAGGARITLTFNGGLSGTTTTATTTASRSGNWTFRPNGLSNGTYNVVASAGRAQSQLSFTLDTTAPKVTEALANDTGTPGDNITTDPTLTSSGDPNAVVTLTEGGTTLGTTTANAAGTWTFFTPTGLSQDAHTVVASETDLAGNSGSASLTFTLQGSGSTGGGGGSTSGVPAYDHIVVVMEENHDYNQIIGNGAAPYINSLAAGGALLTNYDAITHPS